MVWIIVVGCIFIALWPIIFIGLEIRSTIKKRKRLLQTIYVAWVGTRKAFDRQFRVTTGVYYDEKENTRIYCIAHEEDARGLRFDRVVRGTNTYEFYKLYNYIVETRLKEDNNA